MKNEKERIESLRRVIKQKRATLGVEGSILTLKSLKKYTNLSELKYPKSVSAYSIYGVTDIKERFENIGVKGIYDYNKLTYVFDKIVNILDKHVMLTFKEQSENLTFDESVELVNAYIKENTLFTDLYVKNESDSLESKFAVVVLKENCKIEVSKAVRVYNRRNYKYPMYSTIDSNLPDKVNVSWNGRRNEYKGLKICTFNLGKYIAKGVVAKYVQNYLEKENNKELIKGKLSKILAISDEEYDTLTSCNLVSSMIEDNGGYAVNTIKILMALTMEEMLRESFDIYQYEERLKSLTGDYAKTYMTKKNIPNKILSYMSDNDFLKMFGFVEADEDCEIDKLNKLSKEFKELSKEIYLPVVKNHSLRFRKLGKIKALGVYYPGFNTLAVDLDGVSSFIHEMFHLIDFESGILSLNTNFKPLLERYRNLMDGHVDSLGENHPTYEFWYKGKSKYSRGYYQSNEEAFARMGELYVTEVLKINSSFAKVDYSSSIQQVVYPKDVELLNLIKDYYDNLFVELKSKFDKVIFEDKNNIEEIKTEAVKEEDGFEVRSKEFFDTVQYISSSVKMNNKKDKYLSDSNQVTFF